MRSGYYVPVVEVSPDGCGGGHMTVVALSRDCGCVVT